MRFEAVLAGEFEVVAAGRTGDKLPLKEEGRKRGVTSVHGGIDGSHRGLLSSLIFWCVVGGDGLSASRAAPVGAFAGLVGGVVAADGAGSDRNAEPVSVNGGGFGVLASVARVGGSGVGGAFVGAVGVEGVAVATGQGFAVGVGDEGGMDALGVVDGGGALVDGVLSLERLHHTGRKEAEVTIGGVLLQVHGHGLKERQGWGVVDEVGDSLARGMLVLVGYVVGHCQW